ncbi:dioxygenase family protein [Crossiella sp. NPDC003009]
MRRDDAPPPQASSRRRFIRSGALGMTAAALAAGGVTASGGQAVAAFGQPVRPPADGSPAPVTPACSGRETPAAMEGPLFRPESPERTDFRTPAITGVFLSLRGIVYDTGCRPVPRALLEFWQCDQHGDYDVSGFSLRGHQYTGADGGYRLETIIPRDYYGRWGRRAPHIHTHVQAPGGPLLVTQLYFPDNTVAYGRDFAALNAQDALINRACTIMLNANGSGAYGGRFDFVVKRTVS